jgi:hypothetical protein
VSNGPLPSFERLPSDLGVVALAVVAPELIASLNKQIDALAPQFDAGALAPAEKAEKLKALDARSLELERIEEAILDRLGGTVARRDGVSPLAALGIEVLDEEPAEPVLEQAA